MVEELVYCFFSVFKINLKKICYTLFLKCFFKCFSIYFAKNTNETVHDNDINAIIIVLRK